MCKFLNYASYIIIHESFIHASYMFINDALNCFCFVICLFRFSIRQQHTTDWLLDL